MSITVFIGHKIKEREFLSLINMYEERIRPYVSLKLKYSSFSSNKDDCYDARKEEEKHLLSFMENYDYTVLTDIKGVEMNSQKFASFISDTMNYKGKSLFIIGGSCGVSENVKKNVDKIISFSNMTFPYQLFSVIFLEQLYRAITIIKQKRYHK